MKLHALTKAITLATLLSAASLSAIAADVPLSVVVEADQISTKVISVDTANKQVVLEGPQGNQATVQLTEKAKNLDNLKPGDQVDIKVTRAVAAYLDTDVDQGLPGTIERAGEARAAPGSSPAGEAYRQVKVQLKITAIDLKKNRVTLETPQGQKKIIDVEKPEIQAKLKNLKIGQSVYVVYTDVLSVKSTPKS
ncbi:hypothetical protein ACSFE6_25130 [Pseudomonas baetica]|uniref:hypothetical protein n=1 Tax=Pseudomonas baetica TaxID=674054 RepID=UPI003EEFEE37